MGANSPWAGQDDRIAIGILQLALVVDVAWWVGTYTTLASKSQIEKIEQVWQSRERIDINYFVGRPNSNKVRSAPYAVVGPWLSILLWPISLPTVVENSLSLFFTAMSAAIRGSQLLQH